MVVDALLLVLGLLACGAPVDPLPPLADPGTSEQVRRLAAILDYVAADYAIAVDQGAITNALEYEEQRTLLADAGWIAAELPQNELERMELDAEIAGIRARVEHLAPPAEVASAAYGTRTRLLARYGVVLAPAAPPQFARGHDLYKAQCASCHGERGHGDGALAPGLVPAPASFHDPELMAALTPARAFSALTDGLDGTAMLSFRSLSAADRWSLAFYVFTLRHDPGTVAAGREAYAASRRAIAATATRLAGVSDGEIERALERPGLTAERRRAGLAFLRIDASYRMIGAPFDATRARLAAALVAHRAGQPALAGQQLGAAYLDGFEPHEAALGVRDAKLVVAIETAFLAARSAFLAGADSAAAEQHVLRIGALLDSAEERLTSSGGSAVAFTGSLLVLLREGLEGALLILLLLGWAGEAGTGARERRSVHAGWIGALAAGALTWLAAGSALAWLGGARRELLEGFVALAAAAVLILAGHFVLARLDARRRVQALRRRLGQATSPARRQLVLVSLAFVAVYREAFEVVLFLRALLLDIENSGLAVAAGAATGVVILAAAVVLAQRLGRSFSPSRWLAASGALLCALALVLAGSGVRSLQEAGVISIHPLGTLRVAVLGLYPTVETQLAQLLALAAFAGIALWALLRARQTADAAPAPTQRGATA